MSCLWKGFWVNLLRCSFFRGEKETISVNKIISTFAESYSWHNSSFRGYLKSTLNFSNNELCVLVWYMLLFFPPQRIWVKISIRTWKPILIFFLAVLESVLWLSHPGKLTHFRVKWTGGEANSQRKKKLGQNFFPTLK